MSDVFINSAKMVDEDVQLSSCHAIFIRVGGHGFSNALFFYRRMFTPERQHGWWNGRNTVETQQARVYALLLAHAMHQTGDL